MNDLSQIGVQALSLVLGTLPVVSFLLALMLLDSYKLVRLRLVLLLVATGCAVALVCAQLNPWLKDLLGAPRATYVRYEAPLVEELLKGAVIVVAIWRRRIGFLVDAAISGFAVGAGFAAVENLHYLLVIDSPSLAVFTIRGFGTAIMHGGATAILAVSSKHLTERFESRLPHIFLPGLALAAGIHSLFNHFYLSPTLTTLALLLMFPFIFILVFRVSEDATHQWLGVGFDTDQELLEVISQGRLAGTRVGRYLADLKDRFPPEAVADMVCLIRLHLELSIRAKGVLLMQKAGFQVPPDPEVEERFTELKFLEKSVGKTGLMALHPIFSMSSRDLWQFQMLRQQGKVVARGGG